MTGEKILKIYNEWANDNALLGAYKNEISDNDILFVTQFVIIIRMLGFGDNEEFAKIAIDRHIEQGQFVMRPNTHKKISHDNLTAILSLSYIYDLKYHKEFNLFSRLFHPRDFFYYAALKYKKLQFILKPLVAIFMYFSIVRDMEKDKVGSICKDDYILSEDVNYFETKYHKYILSIIKTYSAKSSDYPVFKTYDFIATSTKLLAFVRLKTLNFGWIEKFLTKKLEKKFHQWPWYEIMHIYFKDFNHPNVLLMHEYYSEKDGVTSTIFQ